MEELTTLSQHQKYGADQIGKLEVLHEIYYNRSYSRQLRAQALQDMEELKEDIVSWINSF